MFRVGDGWLARAWTIRRHRSGSCPRIRLYGLNSRYRLASNAARTMLRRMPKKKPAATSPISDLKMTCQGLIRNAAINEATNRQYYSTVHVGCDYVRA